jgi:hypothetical protein
MRSKSVLGTLARLAIAVVLVVGPSRGEVAAAAPGRSYAGQGTGIVFTGIWTWINVPFNSGLHNSSSQLGYWIGKERSYSGRQEWAQTGWSLRCLDSCSTQLHYLEYTDYANSYAIVHNWGPAQGYNQYAVWGDSTGGVDGIGSYFNTFINVRSVPDSTSPSWTTRLTDLWQDSQAVGEVYSATTYHEPMLLGEFGWSGSFEFFDLAVYEGPGPSATWSIWDTRTTPVQYQDPGYTYTPLTSWYHFKISGGNF